MRVELHAHTSEGSNCAHDTADETVERAWREGLDALCLADHNSLAGFRSVSWARHPDDILVVPAVECTLWQGAHGGLVPTDLFAHVLVIGEDPGVLAHLDRPGHAHESPASIFGGLDRSRSFVAWAHPLFCLDEDGNPSESALELLSLVDAVELRNGGRGDMSALSPALFAEARRRGLPETCGSDSHYRSQVARETLLLPGSATTPAGLITLLKAGGYAFDGKLPRPSKTDLPRPKYLTV